MNFDDDIPAPLKDTIASRSSGKSVDPLTCELDLWANNRRETFLVTSLACHLVRIKYWTWRVCVRWGRQRLQRHYSLWETERRRRGIKARLDRTNKRLLEQSRGWKPAPSVPVSWERSCFLDGFWNDMRGGESHSYGVWFWSRSFKAPHPLCFPSPPLERDNKNTASALTRTWVRSAPRHAGAPTLAASTWDVSMVCGGLILLKSHVTWFFDIPECEYPGHVELKRIIFYTSEGEEKLKTAFSSPLQCDCAVITSL